MGDAAHENSPAARRNTSRAPATLLASLFLGALVVAWSAWGAWTQQRQLEALLSAEGEALVEALAHAAEQALLATREIDDLAAERILDQARLLQQLESDRLSDPRVLETLAGALGLYRVVVLDESLHPLQSSTPASGESLAVTIQPYLPALQPLQDGSADWISFEPRPAPDGSGTRYAAAARRRHGGVVLVVVDANELLAFDEAMGVEHLLDTVVGTGGIRYAVLLDEDGSRLTGSEAESEADDTLLELERPVQLAFDRRGALRIGLSAEPVLAANRAGWRRTGILALVVAGFALTLSMVSVARRRADAARGEMAHARAVTDAVLDGMSDAVVVLDAGGVVRRVNPAAARLFGRDATELVNRPCAETPCGQLLARRDAFVPVGEAEVRAADGSAVPVLCSISPVREQEGLPAGTAVVLRDLSELRNLERHTRRAESLSALGRLAGAVAHEVRNPLNSISVGVQRLDIEFQPDRRPEEYRRLTGLLRAEVRRLDEIVDRFLDLARAPELRPEPGDLDALVRDVATLMADGTPAGVRVTAQTGGLPSVRFDATAVRQILINLVRNAVEAVTPPATVRIVTRAEDGRAVVEVVDNGPGIPPADRERMFEFGFTTKPTGTGMGLPVVHRLAVGMGGQVSVESAEGQGTTVRIVLPLATPAGRVEQV